MNKKHNQKTNIDRWLELETPHKRKALENASRYFDHNDNLTVNTLEAVYGKESSFGKLRRKRYISGAAGASPQKVKEICEYVEKVMTYQKEFSKKSKADKRIKYKKVKKYRKSHGMPSGDHWVTIDGRHVLIEN